MTLGSIMSELNALKAQVAALSKERTGHTVRTSERHEMYGSVRGVIPYKSPYHVTQDDNWNSIVVTSAIATDNATNFNLHLVNTLKTARDGTYQVAIPGGITRYNTTPRLLQNAAGVEFVMGGANLGEGDDPDQTSWFNQGTPTSSFFFGTEDYCIGYGSAAVWELTDVTCFRWKGGSIRGDGTDPAHYGILVGKADGGLGPSTLYFEQLAFHNCDHAINVGRVTSSSGGYAAENCSEVVALQLIMKDCTYGYVTMHGQAVNHLLLQPQMGTGTLYGMIGGGGMTMIQPVTFDSSAVVEAIGGGSNTGVTMVIGGRYDTAGTINTKLWNGTDDNFNVGVFFGGGAVYNAAVPNGARIVAQPNHFVSVYHHHNLSDSGGSKPVFESAATGAKIVGLYGVWLIPESYRSFSRSDNIGTWHTNGDWVARDCIDNTNYVRVRDAEYPRLNGRSSTHAYEREFDFEQVGDGMAGLLATVVGTGTVTAVLPWTKYNVGIAALDTGSGATDAAGVLTAINALAFQGGPWRLEILARLMQLSVVSGGNPDPANVTTPYGGTSGIAGGDASLNDSDETFNVRIGFMNAATGAPTNGAFFLHSVASTFWQCITVRAGGATTTTTTSVTADQTATVFEVKVNPAGTSVSFYINGVDTPVATHTTNIPLAASSEYVGYGMSITKALGTSNRYAHIDYVRCEFVPSTQRGTAHAK